jgi:nucleotide-binding universal stress UspA family protein
MVSTYSGPSVQLKHILLVTDLSAEACRAYPYVRDLARERGSTVFLFHQLSPHPPRTIFSSCDCGTGVAYPEAPRIESDHSLKIARREIARMVRANHLDAIPHEVIIRRGDLWEAVTTVVCERGVDLIVAATHDRSGISRLWFGSTGEELACIAPRPVLTIGPRVVAPPEQGWQLRTILCATDLAQYTSSVLEFALLLAADEQAKLIVVHSDWSEKHGSKHQDTSDVTAVQRQINEVLRRHSMQGLKIAAYFSEAMGAAAVITCAMENHADAIVMEAGGLRRLALTGSYALNSKVHQVIAESVCPVFTVHP